MELRSTEPDFQLYVKAIKEAAIEASKIPNYPEKKLRELVAPIWDHYIRAKRINLHLNAKDERQLANGRADTVFNRLILEYKKPGVIKENIEKNHKLIDQVRHYIEDLAVEERWREERLLGVAFDGNYFLYIRKVGKWVVETPEPVTAGSVAHFLQKLENLTTKAALVPDNLIRDFAIGSGARNFTASNTIKAFYFALVGNRNPRVNIFFQQWALQFAEVHGSFENKKFDAETLFNSYGFKKSEQKDFDFFAFFFALDTYYALLMKLLAYQVVGYYTLKSITGLPLAEWEKDTSEALKEKLSNLEDGGIFRSLGIRNFLEGDLLSWYLNDWNEDIDKTIREIIERLNQYDPETMEILPDETRDILKKLYQFLVPKQIRHDLGEYYTPDWLAERCLNQVGYGVKESELLSKRVLDPGCGSGTFLILAIKRLKEHAWNKKVPPAELINGITKNIVGFDLNPLAVISARTNYLLAIADLLRFKKGDVTIPVYLCDSINPPQAKVVRKDSVFRETLPYEIRTAVGSFYLPEQVVSRREIQKLSVVLEDSVKKKLNDGEFLRKAQAEMELSQKDFDASTKLLSDIFKKLCDLEDKGINGIWARIIKNAFAPLFMGTFDIIVGNPPWVNWEALPQDYRDILLPVNQNRYKLFENLGKAGRHGSTKIDLSTLMFYVAVDKYLKVGGKLSFVITQSVFKTTGASRGFRKFFIEPSRTPIKIIQVDDMVKLKPFDNTSNKTSVLVCEKGKETQYPIPYVLWSKSSQLQMDYTLDKALTVTTRKMLSAVPVDEMDKQSAWITLKAKSIKFLDKMTGLADYTAKPGVCTWLNSVYWIEVTSINDENECAISNIRENAKKKVKMITATIEDEYVFPLLRGKDVVKWGFDNEHHILVPHSPLKPGQGVQEPIMAANYPKTYEYLNIFKDDLSSRNGYVKYLKGRSFYSLYNIGAYTFSQFKVAWARVSNNISASVVMPIEDSKLGKNKYVIPIETIVFVPFDELTEAHYFCAMINSSPSRFVISSYSNKGTGSFGSPHILEHISIRKYDPSNDIHQELARLSLQCHEKTAAGIPVDDLEEQIDELAAELWGLTAEELKDIKDSLEEMK